MNSSVEADDNGISLIWNKLCDAVNRNDASIVAKILQCRKLYSISINDPLLCSSTLADQLLLQLEKDLSILCANMNYDLSIQEDTIDDMQLQQADVGQTEIRIKALLISPSLYETPWKMCCSFVQFMHQSSNIHPSASKETYPNSSNVETAASSLYRAGVTDIQCFLRQVVTAWWDEEKKQTSVGTITASPGNRRRSIRPVNEEVLSDRNSRYWMMKFVEMVADPLFTGNEAITTDCHETLRQTSHEDWVMSQELISTIVFLCNDVEQSALHEVLDLLFAPAENRVLRWDSMLRYIGLATELHVILREKDWSTLYSCIQDAFHMNPCPIPSQHWPFLVEKLFAASVMKISSYSSPSSNWHKLILQLLVLATLSVELDPLYEKMEAKLFSCLSSRSSYALHEWATHLFALSADTLFQNVSIVTSKFCFIKANIILQVWRCVQRSASLQMVSRLVARAFDGSKTSALASTKGDELSTSCWKHVMQLALGSFNQHRHFLSQKNDKSLGDTDLRRQSIAKRLRVLFNDVRYDSVGIFRRLSSDETDDQTTALSYIRAFVHSSLCIDSRGFSELVSTTPASDRAQIWLQFINENVLHCHSNESFLDYVVAVVFLITIYIEIRETRSVLARTMLQTLKSNFTPNIHLICVVYTAVITVVIASSSDDSLPDSDMVTDFDVISELLLLPLPFELYCDVARSMAPLPSGRLALLVNIKKHFEGVRSYSQSPNGFTLPPMNQRIHEGVMCSMYAMVQLIQTPTWGDVELASWFILSDIIIENNRNVPLLSRTWLFQEIKDSVLQGKYNKKVLAHLLRSCVIRLLFILGTQHGSYPFQTDDILSIFDVVFTIIHYEFRDSNDTEKNEKYRFLNRCVFILSNLIGAECHESKAIFEDIEACDDAPPALTNDLDENDIPIIAAFYCLALALHLNGSKMIAFDGHILPSVDEIILLLVERERKELGISNEPNSSSPWFIARFGSVRDRQEAHEFNHISPQVRLVLYDVVVSLLMGPKWWINASFEGMVHSGQSLQVCAHLTSVLTVKRRLSDSLDDFKDRGTDTTPNHGLLFRMFIGFCTFFIPVLKRNVYSQRHFVLTNEMLAATLDLCDLLSIRRVPNPATFSLRQRLECFQLLYSALAEETASVLLIRYLECCCSNGGVMIQNISLKVPDDINCFVRRLRTSIFRCLSYGFDDCIHSVESDCHEFTFTLLNDTNSVVDSELPLNLLIQFIQSLSVDIDVGLSEGLSGGLTHDLYVSIIDSMDQCAKVVLKALKSVAAIESSVLSSLISICISVSKVLEGVLCNFSLYQATALKKTLLLCAGILPSVVRCSRRHTSFSGNYQNSSSPISSELFGQLCNILKSKAEFICVKRTSWDIVAGSEHIGGIRYLSDSDDEVSELSDGFTDFIKSQRLVPEAADQTDKVNTKLLLRTERSWIWSLCCLLEAFENDWSETYSLIQNVTDTSVCEANWSKLHVEIRQRELTLTLTTLCHVFQGAKPQTASTRDGSAPVSSVYVLYMPLSAKMKLCVAVDRILATLRKSIKVIIFHIQADPESFASISCRQSFLEAFSCLYAWLSICTKNTELISGVQKWYMTEKTASARRNNDETLVEDASILNRLPKLVYHCEELLNSLQQLSQALQKLVSPSKSGETTPFLMTFDNWINEMVIGSSSSFPEVVAKKLKFLKEEQFQVQCDFGVLSSDEMIGRKNRKRRIDIAKRMQKERRRKIIRSRNFVVDKWLQADRVTGEDEVVDGDPYADLEDFLVDG